MLRPLFITSFHAGADFLQTMTFSVPRQIVSFQRIKQDATHGVCLKSLHRSVVSTDFARGKTALLSSRLVMLRKTKSWLEEIWTRTGCPHYEPSVIDFPAE